MGETEEREVIRGGEGGNIMMCGEAGLDHFLALLRSAWQAGHTLTINGGEGGSMPGIKEGKAVLIEGGKGGSIVFRPDPPAEEG